MDKISGKGKAHNSTVVTTTADSELEARRAAREQLIANRREQATNLVASAQIAVDKSEEALKNAKLGLEKAQSKSKDIEAKMVELEASPIEASEEESE